MSNTTIDQSMKQVAENEPKVTGYNTQVSFFANRYLQGTRVVYSLDFSPAQIAGLLPAPDPSSPQPGNRRITPAHAAAFGNYVRMNRNWVAPGIVLRSATEFEFEAREEVAGTEFGIVYLPFLSLADIHILDGQHRILGIHMAIRAIASDLERTKSALSRLEKRKVPPEDEEDRKDQIKDLRHHIQTLNEQRYRFENERISVLIYVEEDQPAGSQMFYDIGDNALGLPASVKVRFDTRKPVNRVLQDVILHDLLIDRVDLERDVIGRQNTHLLSAKHVADIIRIMAVGVEGRIGRRVESSLNEDELNQLTTKYFDALRDGFPLMKSIVAGEEDPTDVRSRALIGSPVMLRILAGVYRELRKRGLSQLRVKRFFQDMAPLLSQPATKELVNHTPDDVLFVGALSPSARRQDVVALTNTLIGWAEKRPEWMKKA